MNESIPPGIVQKITDELDALDNNMVNINGRQLKPSQCYRFGVNPAHVLFNTNCPDELKEKVKTILAKYIKPNESSA